MANSSVDLISLDFNALKQSLKNHLTSQARFKDYNFDGSNMSVLLDVLTYNTYLNSFYLNMVASEMFLDTAQLRDSVVSHAKELNYLPRSFRSATATVNIDITPDSPVTSVVIPAKTSFTARLGSSSYNFTTKDAVAITESSNGVFSANSVNIYEGYYVTDTFIKNDQLENQRFLLNNRNIDTTSIEITVTENSGSDVTMYTQAYSLFGLTSNSAAFFVQPAENEQYEVVFSEGISGRKPLNGSLVEVSYRVCSGELPNGADTFINNSSIDTHTNVKVSVVEPATGGSVYETIESIKFNAPRAFQAQERAVTESDYKALLLREFPEIQAISVYGGEKEDPPQYGKVFISVDIQNAEGIPDLNKTIYKNYLADRVPLGITPEIVNPEFVYLSISSLVQFNYNTTTLSENQLRTNVIRSISQFNDTYLNDFNADFRYSNLVGAIDDADQSILSNETEVLPYFLYTPLNTTNNSVSFTFNAPLLVTSPKDATHKIQNQKGFYSTTFISDGLTCQIEDDGEGVVRVVKIQGDTHVEVKKVGTINYDTGTVSISGLNVSSYTGRGLKFFGRTLTQNYTSTLKYILTINPEDINVTMIPVRK
jgi:hypothetical protein